MQEGGALSWREVVDRHHSGLIDELSAHLDSAAREAAAQARSAARSDVERLNQVLRRLRAAGDEQVLTILAEGCAPYAEKLVVLVFESGHSGKNQARVAARAGVSGEEIALDAAFDTAQAPAIVSAIESRDPVVALATGGEISPALAQAFGSGSDSRKAYLFPVAARHTVMAMLAASDASASAQIELLCEAAGMRLEAAPVAAKAMAGTGKGGAAWESLSADDQKLHMQAQRMARLRVAEMRLQHGAELKNGTAAGDIYDSLRQPIDAARGEFREAFMARSSTMVDYLHLEILRSLAQDDERLLGAGYPGPMHV
jgi:hypothetical protein